MHEIEWSSGGKSEDGILAKVAQLGSELKNPKYMEIKYRIGKIMTDLEEAETTWHRLCYTDFVSQQRIDRMKAQGSAKEEKNKTQQKQQKHNKIVLRQPVCLPSCFFKLRTISKMSTIGYHITHSFINIWI